MRPPSQTLVEFVVREQALTVSEPVLAIAEAARLRHGQSVAAILFYGSCLRRPETQIADGLLDFYLLVDDYRDAYGGRVLSALANALLPPNVFYLEAPWKMLTLRCKYAVMSMKAFQRACRSDAWNVSTWARFSQPSRLIWARGQKERIETATACATAAMTMIANALPLVRPECDTVALWSCALAQTYGSELRSEGSERALEIVTSDRQRYEAITPLILSALEQHQLARKPEFARTCWFVRRWLGKTLNALRLVKAAFTFEGGLDYILWKVHRHTGVTIAVTQWQRRHPLLAAPAIVWKLYRMNAFR